MPTNHTVTDCHYVLRQIKCEKCGEILHEFVHRQVRRLDWFDGGRLLAIPKNSEAAESWFKTLQVVRCDEGRHYLEYDPDGDKNILVYGRPMSDDEFRNWQGVLM